VNGRNPSRLAPPPEEPAPRSPVFEPVVFKPEDRDALLDGVNDLVPAVDPALPRLPVLPASRLAIVPVDDLDMELVPVDPTPRFEANEVRLPAENPFTWFAAMVCCRCAVCCANDAGCAALLCTDPKKWSEPPPSVVDGAAARPLAERLARDGTTGRLPAIMRAPPICSCVAATAETRPAPNCPARTVDKAPLMCAS
jgi:hypothetical protein